jgi:extracellular factor (EF) 3-hydroxypalmitic acid methyl ester biosynthesis protein
MSEKRHLNLPKGARHGSQPRDGSILVVDDEKPQRDLVEQVLSPVFHVRTAASLGEALQIAEQERLLLVIMDYSMPGVSGLEGVGRFQEIYPNTPVVMLTGQADLDLARSAIKVGAAEFILKPFNPEDLLAMAVRTLGNPRTDEEEIVTEPEIPYSVQRRQASSLDLWRGHLPTIPAENRVEANLSGGERVEAKVLRLGPSLVRAEVYDPNLVLTVETALEKIQVWVGNELAYDGAARLTNVISTGVTRICEFTITGSWVDDPAAPPASFSGSIEDSVRGFTHRWEANHQISPGFVLAVADVSAYLAELRSWIEGLELTWHHEGPAEFAMLERLLAAVKPSLDHAFEAFETEAAKVPTPLMGLHADYVRASLHPLLLCAPFIHRCFTKPLGYPGDHGVMNRMLDDPFEGDGLFARLLNAWVIRSGAGDAYRHRVDYLETMLREQTSRVVAKHGRECRVLSLGCGAAREVQRFVRNSHLSEKASVTLLDFSADTIRHAESRIAAAAADSQRSVAVTAVEFSVQQMLAAGTRLIGQPDCPRSGMLERGRYDLVYCAGLFDYLSDRVCRRLLEIFWELAAPGATIAASNFAPANPMRGFMDYVLDWRLNYRDERQVRGLAATESLHPHSRTLETAGGIEVFLRIEKPEICAISSGRATTAESSDPALAAA